MNINPFKYFDRYLGRTVFFGTLLALLILFSIDSIIDLINDLESVGKRGFTVRHAILKLLFGMPQRLYEFMPTALLLGTLIGLGGMAARSELVALRSVGVSKLRILWSVLKVGILLIIVSIWVGEYIAPTTEGYVRSLNKTSDMRKISIRSRHGLWVRDRNRFINVQQVFPDYRMTDVWVYELNEEHKLKRASFAKSAVYEKGVWRLYNIRHSLISTQGIETVAAQEEHWERLVSPDLFDVMTVKPEFMSAKKLKKYVKYLDENELNSLRYQLAYYNRFAVPLSGIAMLLLAVPFVFRSVRAGGLGQRIALGIAIAVVFHLLSRILSNASVVYGFPPLLGAFFPTLLVIVIATITFKRMA